MESPAQPGHRTADDQEQLQDLIEEFERAWRKARTPEKAPFLEGFLPPPDSPLRTQALVELIKADLNFRWRMGQIVVIEDYLKRFPELQADGAPLPALLCEEYHARHEFGDRPELTTYRARFPAHFPTLEQLLPEDPSSHLGSSASVPMASGTEPSLPRPPSSLGGSPVVTGSTLPIGGGYKLLHRIGRGTFGEVWRAEAPGGFPAAVKIIFRPIDHEEAQRELHAMELMKQLRHPYLLQIHGYWALEDRLYIAMELADGSLRELAVNLRQQGQPGIPVDDLLRAFQDAAEGLDYLHTQDVQHRDIKPDNILRLGRHAKVGDFGLARLLENRWMASVTSSGTPPYMAPEVWHGKLSTHSDQYSLAATYAELRLNRRLFERRDIAGLMMAHLQGQPDLGDLPDAEKRVILKAMAKDPAERFGSCLEFLDALREAVQHGATLVFPTSPAAGAGPSGSSKTVPSAGAVQAEKTVVPASTRTELLAARDRAAGGTRAPVATRRLRGLGAALLGAAAVAAGVFAYQEYVKPPAPPGTFSIRPLSPFTIATGREGRLPVRVERDHFRAPITLAVEHLPARVSAVPVKAGADEEEVDLTVSAAADAAPETRMIKLRAQGGESVQEVEIELNVVPLPAGCTPADDELVSDVDRLRFYRRITRVTPAGTPVPFVLVPRTFRGLPSGRPAPDTFYMMVDKVSVGLYRECADARPGLIRNEDWSRGAWVGDGRNPALDVWVEDAWRFASEWLHGNLPTAQQWDKAAGRYDDQRGEGPFRGRWSNERKLRIAVGRPNDGPLPVGTAADDESFFGCRDMAGNGFEWTRTMTPRGEEHSVPLPAGTPPQLYDVVLLRGRSFLLPEPLRFRDLEERDQPEVGRVPYMKTQPDIGFRVVLEVFR